MDNPQEVMERLKCNGMAGMNEEDSIYTITILQRLTESITEGVKSIVPITSRDKSEREDFKRLYKYAQQEDGWFAIIDPDEPQQELHDHIDCFVIVILNKDSWLYHSDRYEHYIRTVVSAHWDYWQ